MKVLVAAVCAIALAHFRPHSFVRYALILPLQSVFPLALSLALYRLTNASWNGDEGQSLRGFLHFSLGRLRRQCLRMWLTAEIWFFVYYLVRRRLLQQNVRLPKPMQPDERCDVTATSDIVLMVYTGAWLIDVHFIFNFNRKKLLMRCLSAIELLDEDKENKQRGILLKCNTDTFGTCSRDWFGKLRWQSRYNSILAVYHHR